MSRKLKSAFVYIFSDLFEHSRFQGYAVDSSKNRIFIFILTQVVASAEWRKLHKEELNDLYSSPNIVGMIKSRRIWWAGHAARISERRGVYRVLVGKSEGKRPLGRPRIDRSIILRWVFRKWDVGVWTVSSWLRVETGGGHLWKWKLTFGFHRMRGISWLAENRLASEEGLCSME